MKFIPLTGVTLPLVSYGGSSVLTTLIIFAVMQGLFMIYYTEEKQRKKEGKTGNRRGEKTKNYVEEWDEEA